MRNAAEDTVDCRFFAPVEQAFSRARSRRSCPEFPDHEFLHAGISRVLHAVRSGRDLVQQLRMWMNRSLTVCNFFQSLKSKRRLTLVREVDEDVCGQLDEAVTSAEDPLAAHPELDGFAVYASDGHFEKPSSHCEPIEDKKRAAGNFYSINLRSHSLRLLDIARPTVKQEHDMHALKRLGYKALRMGEPTGTKVIHVYDPAGIDYEAWMKWKAKGIYMLSREKENSAAMVVGINAWDHEDSRNNGVLSDELVGSASGVLLRRVRFQDLCTGIVYSFLTNEMTLPPGLIAFLYKLRWDVEKVFDEKKSKLEEGKAWAKTDVARTQQAHFTCLAHNLMVLFELCLLRQENIRDEKAYAKREKRAAKQIEELARQQINAELLPMSCDRITVRSLQFIRWLRHVLFNQTPWEQAMRSLRPLMSEYLS